MVGLNEKAQKAANVMRKGDYIILLGSRGACKPPADSSPNSGGIQGEKPLKAPRSLILWNLKMG